jgi:capsular polysaccharide biosynthesis protein
VSRLNRIAGVTVNVLQMENMTFADQLKQIRQAHILIGNHGAALSHLMFMDDTKSHVIEISSKFSEFFEYLSQWKGIDREVVFASSLSPDAIVQIANLVEDYVAIFHD